MVLQGYNTRVITFLKYRIFYKAFIRSRHFCSQLIITILSSERLLETTKRVEVLRCEGRNQTHCGGSAACTGQVSVAVGTRSHLKPGLEFLMRVLTRAGMTDKANIKMTLYILLYFSQIEFP